MRRLSGGMAASVVTAGTAAPSFSAFTVVPSSSPSAPPPLDSSPSYAPAPSAYSCSSWRRRQNPNRFLRTAVVRLLSMWERTLTFFSHRSRRLRTWSLWAGSWTWRVGTPRVFSCRLVWNRALCSRRRTIFRRRLSLPNILPAGNGGGGGRERTG